jgi:hypothetical protein
MKFIAINCVDPSLIFEVATEPAFDLPAYGSTGNESFTWLGTTLCLNAVSVDLSVQYPQGTWGLYNDITCEILPESWNGEPVYQFSITETQHSIPGLIINYYILFNSIDDQWEVWDGFDRVTGPFCVDCCDDIDRPYLIINDTRPVTDIGVEWVSTNPDTEICDDTNSLQGIRESFYCPIEYSREFTDCWEFIEDTEPLPVLNPENSIILENITFFEDCEDCLGIRNTPPCIKLTNCLTDGVTIVSYSDILNSYVGKVLKLSVSLNNSLVEICYKVSYSPTCPGIPVLLPGTIVDCFQTCEKCLNTCECSKAKNNASFPKRLSYIDCRGLLKETTEVIAPGTYSLKYCVNQWADQHAVDILKFGACEENKCPEVVQPQKFIAPGYNTNTCTPEHYEKIVCKYSELKYIETMNKRYGLNLTCSDEDLTLATIKYQLLQMQILKDPRYNCVENNLCNNCNC